MPYRKKLIEVALPLEAINKESAREKSIRHGHPSTLHLWWARRPLAACRAVLWSSLVDDPSEYLTDEKSANEERERLFKILEDLVLWENINNEEVLDKARLEIARSVARDLGVDVPVGKEAIREFLATKAPPVLDPFAGGGSIPLEAQRLGLRAYASDLNPVAVLINKALIEIPPKFSGMPPVHPPENGKEQQGSLFKKQWKGAEGLAEDVRYYGKWMRDEAEKRIGYLYPKAKITEELLAERPDLKNQGLKPGDELTVIAWLWARTVKCPNPACGTQMPLIKSFELATKKGKETWLEPSVTRSTNSPQIEFLVRTGKGKPTEGTISRNGAHCIACGTPVTLDYIRQEGQAGRIKFQMIGIVALGNRGRCYLPATQYHSGMAEHVIKPTKPDQELQGKLRVSVPLYGMNLFGDLFTDRQIVSIQLFCDLVKEAYERILVDTLKNGHDADYAKSVAVYLSLSASKQADSNSTLCSWMPGVKYEIVRNTFSRQALAMTWDFAEPNPFAGSSGDFEEQVERAIKVLQISIPVNSGNVGTVIQFDAAKIKYREKLIVSTDPPYYDNIEYADLSDFFYVWLRKSLVGILPDLFATVLTPKSDELVASPFRYDTRQEAENFFETKLRQVFERINQSVQDEYPVTVFYAFKQSENEDEEDEQSEVIGARASTGWETMLDGLTKSNFEITGTWPMRTELANRSVGLGTNALASSIVLVCRPRPTDAGNITRREFLAVLKKELAPALRQLQLGSIAPVDFAQAAIGPGMAVYSRYQSVLESDGSSMRVRTALMLINQALDEFLSEQEGEYDGDTRWALAWYEQFGHNEAAYGVAETLSSAKNTSVKGLAEAGILEARAGKVRLLRREELDTDWDPEKDKRLTAWESVQHLIYALDKNGEEAAAALLGHLGGMGEPARDLAYRLYTICERKGWAQDALAYNMLVVAWPRLKELSANVVKQAKLL